MTENRRSDDSEGKMAETKACGGVSQKNFTKLSWNCKALAELM